MSRRLVASVLVSSVMLSACGGAPEADASSAAVTVQLGPEGITVAQQTMLASGPILAGALVADRTAQIRAEVPGSVLQVLKDPGAVVAAGTSLAKIDDRAISDQFLSARSGVAAAEAAADLAARELARAEKLGAAGAIAERDLENARRADLVAKTGLYDARARLAQAQKQIDATNVLTPYAGIVSERFVNPGDVVAPGAPLFVVIDPATMKLEAAVPAAQLASVRVGAPVRFVVTGYPGQTFEGRIASINPAADPQTRQVRLTVRIPNSGNRLVAGLFAEGRVASDAREALTVPEAAVDRRGLAPAVVRLRNGVTERIEVALGARDEAADRVEITRGLAAGDTILVGAALGISAGTPLRVRPPADTAARGN
ncbi:MAG: efflux RND transporter periplasmic adaptor subunit [Gemmatimonadaceae bacterium]|jgi:membrane fusion protein (multidrug efflux system)